MVTSARTGSPDPSPGPSDRHTFDDVFCGLLHRLYRRAAMLSGSRQSAEDAVHETYLKLAARPQRLTEHPEPYAYAFSALLSVTRDTWRKERRHVLVSEPEDEAPALQGGHGGGGHDGGVEERAAELEAVRLLRQLSVRQAGVVILVDLDGYTIDQAAEILRLHRGTVARTRTRALAKLRGVLTPAGRATAAAGGEQHAG